MKRARTVLFLAPEPLGRSLTGPARRTVKLAECVAKRCEVTLAAPEPSTFPDGPFRTLETGPLHDQRLAEAFASHDVSVVQILPSPRQLFTAMRHARRLVVDVLAPLALEAAAIGPPGVARDAMARWRARELSAHLAASDLVLCTNEKQRDLLLGVGLATGLLTGGAGAPPLQERIAVVPHGLDDEPAPRRTGAPLRRDGAVGADDRVAVWAGGLWSWLDPLTAIRALEGLRPERPELKLAFVGFEHPDPDQRRGHEAVAAEAIAYARDRSLEGSVVFRPRWLSRDEYLEHLMDADVGVSLHAAGLEGRFASRTRVLDYLEAGLPVVCSSGDTMSDVVAAHGLGEIVRPQDADDCARALDALTRGEARPSVSPEALAPLRWSSVARPLVDYCADGDPDAAPSPTSAALAVCAPSYPVFLRSVYGDGGPREVARALGRRFSALGRARR